MLLDPRKAGSSSRFKTFTPTPAAPIRDLEPLVKLGDEIAEIAEIAESLDTFLLSLGYRSARRSSARMRSSRRSMRDDSASVPASSPQFFPGPPASAFSASRVRPTERKAGGVHTPGDRNMPAPYPYPMPTPQPAPAEPPGSREEMPPNRRRNPPVRAPSAAMTFLATVDSKPPTNGTSTVLKKPKPAPQPTNGTPMPVWPTPQDTRVVDTNRPTACLSSSIGVLMPDVAPRP